MRFNPGDVFLEEWELLPQRRSMLPLSTMIKNPLFIVGTEDYAFELTLATVYASGSKGQVDHLLIAGEG